MKHYRFEKVLAVALIMTLASSAAFARGLGDLPEGKVGSVLNLTLKDGTSYHFLIADQKPVIKSRNGQLVVTYHYADGGSLAPQLSFERDAVECLTFGAYDPVCVVAPTELEQAVRFDLLSPNRIHVCGLNQGDLVEAVSLNGRNAVPARRAVSGELTLDLNRQPRGVYIVSVNRKHTFKFVKP